MAKRAVYFLSFLVLTLLVPGAPAQVLWKHTVSDVWLNPSTQEVDSFVCFTAISCLRNDCYAAAQLDQTYNFVRLGMFRSNDGGRSWKEGAFNANYKIQLTNTGIRKIQQVDSLNVIAMGYEYGAIFRTTDGGNSWFNIDAPVQTEMLDIHFSDPLTGVVLCANNDSNIFTTTDGGVHWVHRPFQPVNACHSFGNGKYAFLRYAYGPIYTTDDDFATFDSSAILVDTLADPLYVYASMKYGEDGTVFVMGNHFAFDSLTGVYKAEGLIMRSTTNGKTWENPWVFPRSKLQTLRYITRIDRDTIFAAGNLSHHIFSSDRGKTWRLDSNITDTTCDTYKSYGIAMAADGHPVAIFGMPGLLYRSIIFRGEYPLAKVEFNELAKYYTHIYPNPTTGLLTIETQFTLPISVIDIFGREVAKGALPRNGKLAVDLSYAPEGIYNIVFEWMGKKYSGGKVAVVH